MLRKTLLISLMILPVSQAMAVPKVVGNGFSENMTIGQSEDTLGMVRDKANAAMPKTGGEFGGSVTAASLTSRNGLGLDKGDVRIGTRGNLILTTAENAVAAYFSSDASGDLLINTGIAGGGGIRPVAYTFDALTKSPTKGSIHICSDCMINGHRFVAVMWNGSTWTGLSGEEVTH